MSKHIGDRRDGTYLKNIDSMHTIMPLMYPNRCDNEAFISEPIWKRKTRIIRSTPSICFRSW